MNTGTWQFTTSSRLKILDGTFDSMSATGAFKVALFRYTSDISSSATIYSGLTNECYDDYGYTTGGVAITCTLSYNSGVETIDIVSDPSWNCTGWWTPKYAVIYHVTSGWILCYCDLHTIDSIGYALGPGDLMTLVTPTTGILTLT